MDALEKWVAKNRILAWILMDLLFGFALFVLIDKIIVFAVLMLVSILINYLVVESSVIRLMLKPLVSYQEGDPEPLLNTTAELLTYRLTDANRLTVAMNYCVALREHHRYEEALDLLLSVNVDRPSSGASPVIKFVYYNNLSDLYDLLGEDAPRDLYAQKALQIYNDLPDGRAKKNYLPTFRVLSASLDYRAGEYDRALQTLLPLPEKPPVSRLEYSFLVAKVLLAAGQRAQATEYLNQIIENGRNLGVVRRARNLLSSLEQN